MKKFQVVTDTLVYNFNFPTSLDEISEQYLQDVTKNVNIADNYTLIGLVYHEKLFDLIIARKQAKKSFNAAIVPIFIRCGKTDSDFIKSIKCKDKLVIPSSSISLGHHIAAPQNVLNIDYFCRAIDKDVTLAKRYDNKYGDEHCFFVEFKLVPNVDIIGSYDKAEKVESTFVEISPKAEGVAQA